MSYYLMNRSNGKYLCSNEGWRQLLSVAYNNGWRPIINSDWQPTEDDHDALHFHFEYEKQLMNEKDSTEMINALERALANCNIGTVLTTDRIKEFIEFAKSSELLIY
jgi:hypothetical protein